MLTIAYIAKIMFTQNIFCAIIYEIILLKYGGLF